MLEVHHRMHMLWSQGRHKRQKNLEQNSDSSIDQSTLTLKDAAEEWLEAAQRHELEHQSESAILEAVADELLGSTEEGDGGASVLCFDEVQVRWCLFLLNATVSSLLWMVQWQTVLFPRESCRSEWTLLRITTAINRVLLVDNFANFHLLKSIKL